VEVRPAHDVDEIAAALRLRERVFKDEQGVPVEADRDGRDPEALHLVAVESGKVVGTCRLVFDGPVARLGRMAVEPSRRRGGVGSAVLREAERHARAGGARRISLHAQCRVEDLYVKDGYVATGSPFVEEGIDHVAMEKVLA
jgi:predicted GNAT family N-acyltransferase